MAAIVGTDAKVEISTDGGTTWTLLTERNSYSLSINVDSAEHKAFVASIADAWIEKSRTWMSWSGSLDGYYDDGNDEIFDTVVAGAVVGIRLFPTRSQQLCWAGNVVFTSIDQSTGTDDFATLSVDFEGQGALTKETITP